MQTIHNYKIGGGTGDILEIAYQGTKEEFKEWLEDIRANMLGETFIGDAFQLAWHSGDFHEIYNENQTTTVLFVDDGKDECIFGIYNRA